MKRRKIKDVIDIEQMLTPSTPVYSPFMNTLRTQLQTVLSTTYDIDVTSTMVYKILSDILDFDYFSERLDKYISPFFNLLVDKYTDIYDIADYLMQDVANKYAFKWYKIALALTTNYKPLENYDMEEIRTPDLQEDITRNEEKDVNVHQDTESGIYGFNSESSQPTATGSGDTHTTGAKAKNEITDTKTNTGTETLTRHGNIGVTTSQQMLESEIKLRQYDFIEEVYKDIDSVLCLKVY